MPLIGNKHTLAVELLPVSPTWERRYAPERGAWAGVAFWVGGLNLCQHVRPGAADLRDHLFVPLAPVSDWLVHVVPALEFEERAPMFPTTRRLHESAEYWGDANPPSGLTADEWIDAREDWWTRHFLRAGSDGALIPDIAFVRDDEQLVVDWARPRFVGEDAPLLLNHSGEFALPWAEGHETLRGFVAEVSAWLRQEDMTEDFSWSREDDPLSAPTELQTALERYTGRDLAALVDLMNVDGLDDLLQALHLNSTATDPAASPQCQILRDLSPITEVKVAELLDDIGARVALADNDALACWREGRKLSLDAARSAASPEAAGQGAALELRKALGLDGQPLEDHTSVLSRFDLDFAHSDLPGGHERMVVGLLEDGSAIARTLATARTATPWGQRFEAFRALGHVLLDPVRSSALGAASGPYAQETRRRRSGAFAAELLLPESALAAASKGRLDGAADEPAFTRLLEEYGVGARAAAFQLWNRGWLSSQIVRDELIDRFSAVG